MENRILARVRFLTSAEGGRTCDVSGVFYSAPVFVDDGEGLDCRILLNGRTLCLGEIESLELIFLNPHAALPRLCSGTHFTLWEGKTVAEGVVV